MTTDTPASAPRRPAEMARAYEHQQVEQRLYAWWERSGFFAPRDDAPRPPFVISIPPPNVTGELHLGHAMFVTIEDLLIRWRRMQGHKTLWVPGTDHAGIATQTQVEKLLLSEGTSRQAVGREEFLRRTWEWKEKYGGEITPSCAGWALRATGRANASLSTPVSRGRCTRPSSASTTMG